MTRRLSCEVLIICTAFFSYAVSGQNNSGTAMILSIKVCEKAAEGSDLKILAEPTLAATAGRPFSFESGGSVRAKTGGGDFDIGTRVTGKFELTDTGTVQLALKVRTASAVPQDETDTDVMRTETLEIRSALRPGKMKRLSCSASQWCEVTVEPIE